MSGRDAGPLAHAATAFASPMGEDDITEHVGPYEAFETLGYGAMAQVLLARHRERPSELLALKRLMPHMEDSPDVVEMFLDEARIGSYLDHPNIAGTVDHGEHDGTHFIALEFVVGVSLLEVLRRAAGSIPFAAAAHIASKVTAALGHAHERLGEDGRPLRVVHRDIKPSNVLLDVEGVVKLIDFGVAKATDRLHQTLGPVIKGSLAYMSPEQASAKAVDHRSDIYGAGILLYELLCGRNPQMGKSDLETLDKVSHGKIPPPSSYRALPPELDAICMKALAKDPSHRYQRAAEMSQELESYSAMQGFTQVSLARWIAELPGEAIADARARHAEMRGTLAPQAHIADAPGAMTTPRIEQMQSDLLTLDSDDLELSHQTRQAIAPNKAATSVQPGRRAQLVSAAPVRASRDPLDASAPPIVAPMDGPPITAPVDKPPITAPMDKAPITAPMDKPALVASMPPPPVTPMPHTPVDELTMEHAAPLDETAPRPRAPAARPLRLLRVAVVMFSVLSFVGLGVVVWWTVKPDAGSGSGTAGAGLEAKAKVGSAGSVSEKRAVGGSNSNASASASPGSSGSVGAARVGAKRSADASAATKTASSGTAGSGDPDQTDAGSATSATNASAGAGAKTKTTEHTTLKRKPTVRRRRHRRRRIRRRRARRARRRRRVRRRTRRRETPRRSATKPRKGAKKRLGDQGASW